MRHLFAHGVGFYCPIARRKIRHPSGRRRESFLPLFSNYVFIAGDESARLLALTSNCVSHTLEVADPVTLERQLRHIHQALCSKKVLQFEPRFENGDRVRIRRGPLAGIEGTVFRRNGRTNLLLHVDLLQVGASLEVEPWEVEPAGPPIPASAAPVGRRR